MDLLIVNVGIAWVLAWAFPVVAYPAMMADAADEHQMLFGARREGLYFAGLGFAAKAASGIGQVAAGFALDALHFPKAAGMTLNAVVPEHVLRLLILAWGPFAALFALAGTIALTPLPAEAPRHRRASAHEPWTSARAAVPRRKPGAADGLAGRRILIAAIAAMPTCVEPAAPDAAADVDRPFR